jgi:uncharacterized DUF497 family protein
MSLQFEWDSKKAEANKVKHGVSFEEAITVFAGPLARIFEDPILRSNGAKSSLGTLLSKI